jgi:hypothetical protein
MSFFFGTPIVIHPNPKFSLAIGENKKITRTPYYIVAIVDHHVSLFLSHYFSLLLVSRVKD